MEGGREGERGRGTPEKVVGQQPIPTDLSLYLSHSFLPSFPPSQRLFCAAAAAVVIRKSHRDSFRDSGEIAMCSECDRQRNTFLSLGPPPPSGYISNSAMKNKIYGKKPVAMDALCPERMLRPCTEHPEKVCTWLRDICSCSCLTVLPGPAWVLLVDRGGVDGEATIMISLPGSLVISWSGFVISLSQFRFTRMSTKLPC